MTGQRQPKVFLMWSGNLSHAVAEGLFKWLPHVIQTVDPFLSSESIRKGQQWRSEIGGELEAGRFGIACVTRDNLHAPWLHFEAGSIAKHTGDALVATLRVNVEEAAITGPLSMFHSTDANTEADMLKLVCSVNSAIPLPVAEDRVRGAFNKFWPELHDTIAKAIALHGEPTPKPPEPGSVDAMLQEILQITRATHRSIAAPPESAGGNTNSTRTYKDALLRALGAAEPGSVRSVQRRLITVQGPMAQLTKMGELLNESSVVLPIVIDGATVSYQWHFGCDTEKANSMAEELGLKVVDLIG